MIGHAIEKIQHNSYSVSVLPYTASPTVPSLSNGLAVLAVSFGRDCVWDTGRPTLGGVLFTQVYNTVDGTASGDPRFYLGYIKQASLPSPGAQTLNLSRSASGIKMIATLTFLEYVHQTDTIVDQAIGSAGASSGVALSLDVVKGGMMIGGAGTNSTIALTPGTGQTATYHASFDGAYRYTGYEGNIGADALGADFSYYIASAHREAMAGISLRPAITPQSIGGGPIFF